MKTAMNRTLLSGLLLVLLEFALPAHAFHDPSLGRWLNRDPLGEEGGISLYQFVYNDPVNWFDPDGHNPKRRLIDPAINWLNNTRVSQWAGRQLDKGFNATRQFIKDLDFDGPQKGGRICQIRYKKLPVARLDNHPIPGSSQEPRLHVNIGPDGLHFPIDPRSIYDYFDRILPK